MKSFLYIIFTGLVFLVFGLVIKLSPSNEISESAGEAELLIANSRLYAQEHAYDRSLQQLEMAIETIESIEQDLDEESVKNIDKALVALKKVYEEIKSHDLNNDDMNRAFTKTMNALTFAELKITEHLLETDDFHEAKAVLKSGMIHIKNALKFVDKGHKSYELHIYAEIDSLLSHPELSKAQVAHELEKMLKELNTLVEE